MSDLPNSADELQPVENTSQWLKTLDVDFDSNPTVPTTPSSIHTDGVSTPALPPGIDESTGTLTPRRFEPEANEDNRTVSDRTYDYIRESYPSKYFFFSSFLVSTSLDYYRPRLTKLCIPLMFHCLVHQEPAPTMERETDRPVPPTGQAPAPPAPPPAANHGLGWGPVSGLPCLDR